MDYKVGNMIENLIQNEITEKMREAAAWRSRYLDEQYQAFDSLALRCEDTVRRLEGEWSALQTALGVAEAMKRAVN